MKIFSVTRAAGRISAGIMSAGLIAVTSPAAFADTNQAVEIRTSEVVVSASRTEKEIQEAPASISVLSREEIERKGTSSIADLLQDVPGVEITDGGVAGAKRIKIRGENMLRVLVLVDGQKVTEQKSMSGVPLLVDPSTIERIEVVKGPASVLYGPEAIGGAINIITKKGGGKPVEGSVFGTYDSATNGYETGASLAGKLDNGFSYRVSGSYSDHGDRRTPDGTLNGTSSSMQNFSGFLGYDTETLSLGLNLEAYESENEAHPDENIITDVPEWSRGKIGAFAEIKDISERIPKLHFDAFAQESAKEFVNDMTIGLAPGMDMRFIGETLNEQNTYGFSSQIDIVPHEDHYLIAGYTLAHETLDARDQKYFHFPMPPGNPPVVTDYFYDAVQRTHALFVQDEWFLPNDFTAILGGRMTWVESKLKGTDDPSAAPGKVTDSKPVFSGALLYSGIENLTLRTSVSQGYRFPNLSNLLVPTGMMGETVLPNPELDPETSVNYEIGARYNNGRLNLDVAGFYSDAEDYITTERLDSYTQRYVNVDSARTFGTELSLSYQPAALSLTPYASATWMKRKLDYGTWSTYDSRTPELMGRFGARYEADVAGLNNAPVWADLYVRAASKAESESSDGSVETYDAWSTLNLSLGAMFRTGYSVNLHLNNLLDERYTTAQSSLMESGRHVVATVRIEF